MAKSGRKKHRTANIGKPEPDFVISPCRWRILADRLDQPPQAKPALVRLFVEAREKRRRPAN